VRRAAMRRVVLLFVILTAASVCPDSIIIVDDDGPADFNNIQDAINDANYGDTIYVAEGIYVENITLKNGVALIGQDPYSTIIDGNDNGSVVISEDCDSNTILGGFTITDGNSMDSGGMSNFERSSPTVTNCTLTGKQ
jgi:nitrous oxidase accessory protein